jgi:hypothetical protein
MQPYDAIAPPKNSQLLGGSPVVPIAITERDRPLLIQLSQLALEDYNDKNQVQYIIIIIISKNRFNN